MQFSTSIDIKKIRRMFFNGVRESQIVLDCGIKSEVMRQLKKERDWKKAKHRYVKYLCVLAKRINISLLEMSRRTGVHLDTLFKVSGKYKFGHIKLVSRNKRVNDKMEEDFIREYLSGSTSKDIAVKYGFISGVTVLDVLKKHGVAIRNRGKMTHYNENFFERIDSPEKAYILGIIMTDGFIIDNFKGVGIELTKEDFYLLENIANILWSDHGITINVRNYARKSLPNTKDTARVTIHSGKIAKDLQILGVVKNKSKILRYKNVVDNKFFSHFFRGLIDGDGSVGMSKSGALWCTLYSGSEMFLKDLLCSVSRFSMSLTHNRCEGFGSNGIIYTLRVGGGRKGLIEFLKWIYKDKGDLYLRRKYEKVQDYIN